MNFSNYRLLLFLAIFLYVINYNSTLVLALENPCGIGDWIAFKDEKCYKILEGRTRNFEDAKNSCAKLDLADNTPSLPVIHTKDDQYFLTNFLFKVSKKVDNFWIGSKYTVNGFKWTDNLSLDYTNWAALHPKNKANYCIQIQSEEDNLGKWIDKPCGKMNAVVCQKLQTWSLLRLQNTLLDARKEMRVAAESANRKNAELNQSLVEANRKIAELKQNEIPIGFIYTQLPKQKSPTEIWPRMTWAHISGDYSGVFFRVEGRDASPFGAVQNGNAPRLTSAQYLKWATTEYTTFAAGSCGAIGTGGAKGNWRSVKFCQSGGEVRPRNMAVRIWKRTK